MNSYKPDISRRKHRKSSSAGRRSSPQTKNGVLAIVRQPAALACFAFVAICMAFGGGPGDIGLSFLAIALAGLVLLVMAVRGPGAQAFQALPLIVRLAVALAVALPLLQLIPLPPGLWQALPGQGLRTQVLTTFGLGSAWLPMSLTPAETAYSAVIGLSMLGLFLSVLAMPHDRVRALVILVVGMIGLGMLIGIVQFSSGGESLQFHKIAHRDALIGFFANKNHMGLTIACLVPLSFILIEHHLDGRRGVLFLLALGWIGLIALVIATNSRAGLLLTLGGILLACLRLFVQHRRKLVIAAFAAAAVVVALASVVPAVRDIADRFGRTGDDVRFDILDRGTPLIEQYGALGSGLGSFASVYAPTEKLQWVNPFYVNHLHNDWLQLIIEGGVPGVIVLLLMLAAVAQAARVMWFSAASARNPLAALLGNERSFAWAGYVIVVMFALHSIGDYPVRRVGTLVLLVLALALVFRPLVDRSLLSRGSRGA